MQTNRTEAVLPCHPAQGKSEADNRDLWLLFPEILPSWNCHVREKRAPTQRVEGDSSNKRLHRTLPGSHQSPAIWSIVHFLHLYLNAERSPHCFRRRKVTSRPTNTTNEHRRPTPRHPWAAKSKITSKPCFTFHSWRLYCSRLLVLETGRLLNYNPKHGRS